ncbi:hypothetical protein ACWD5V_32060, partial [Streptomyces sp. NPDC002523]
MEYAETRRLGGRACAALAVCGALLAGCSGTGDGSGAHKETSASPTRSAKASGLGAAAPNPRFTADPARLPRTRSAAL